MRGIKEKNPERGAALVELAIVLPLLLLILVGIIEFGLLFYNQQVLTNSSREGARAGIAHLEEVKIKEIAVAYCNDRLITFDTLQNLINDDVTVVGELTDYPENLTVTVSYDYSFLIPKLLGLGTSMQLSTETVMNMEVKEE